MNIIKLTRWFAIASIFVSLLACQEASELPATPMKQLPELERKTIIVKPAKNIFVPRSSVIERGGANAVFEVRDQKARIRMIRTGRVTKANIQVISGLKGGETILRENLQSVFDGSPIRTTDSK